MDGNSVSHRIFFFYQQSGLCFWGIIHYAGTIYPVWIILQKPSWIQIQRTIDRLLGIFFDPVRIIGLIIYPAISLALEQSLARTIALGLPCPSTILTFGFLMLSDKKLAKYLLNIPSLWALIGLGAAINFGVYQDFMMIVTAILADLLLIRRKWNTSCQGIQISIFLDTGTDLTDSLNHRT